MGRPKEGVERIPQDNSRSRDAISARVGVSGRTYEKFEQYRRGVRLLRDKGHLGTITKEQARIAAVEDAKVKKDKQQGKRNDLTSDKLAEVNRSGTSNQNVLRRLARDHESILAKVESGELTVNQAAIQAGSTSTQKNRHLR